MNLGDIPWYWQHINLFDGVPIQGRKRFVEQAECLRYRRGQTIFSAGDTGDRVFLLEQGMVKIYDLSAQGDVTIFWFCAPGDLFGAGGISGAERQAVFGQAADRVVVHALPRPKFEALLHAYPQLAINVIKLVGGRLRLACDAVTDNTTRRTDTRLARVLLRLAQQMSVPEGGALRFAVPISHLELANMTGACRQTINRILKHFEKIGWLRFEGRVLIIVQPRQLHEFVDANDIPGGTPVQLPADS